MDFRDVATVRQEAGQFVGTSRRSSSNQLDTTDILHFPTIIDHYGRTYRSTYRSSDYFSRPVRTSPRFTAYAHPRRILGLL